VRAAIWEGPGKMSVGEVADAVCPEDGALLRVTACGICGTDVRSFYNGDRRISPPWVLGHEISGELLEIGPAAARELSEMGISKSTTCTASRPCGVASAACAGAETSTSACAAS
jgi:threonine dehydrogenase-like Zn-dependent dehydrogenase